MVEEATEDDLPEIEALLLTDEIIFGKTYQKGELIKEFADRMRAKKGSNYVIRKNDSIVAHVCITCETDKFCVASYSMVRKDARDFPYGVFNDSFLINTIAAKGKKLYSFLTDEKRIRMFELMGNSIVAEYGKLMKE